MPCNGLCTDFPADPDNPDGVAPSAFPDPTPGGSGPCVLEPEDGTLFPSNWLRPRVNVQGTAGPLKIVIHSDMEDKDLVAYSATSVWTMPKAIWVGLASHVHDAPITVTVRGSTGGASTVSFKIAPVGATGSMVFWAANPALADIDPETCRTGTVTQCANAAELQGFAVGNETVQTVLNVSQVAQPTRNNSGATTAVTCIGCHTGTPDSGFVSFIDSYPWRAVTASVQGATATLNPSGTSYTNVSPGGLEALLQPGWGPFSYVMNKDLTTYWQTGKRIGVASLGLKDPLTPDYSNGPDQNDSPQLAWINLEAPNQHVKLNSDASNWVYVSYAPNVGIDSGNALGFIKRDGDTLGAGMPNWSHDGTQIVYVSTNASISGRFNREVANPAPVTGDPTQNATQQNSNGARAPGLTNLYTVPFGNGLGGTAAPVPGAATTTAEEFYPAFSPDDRFIAFTSVPAGQTMYANPNAELYVVATVGGTAQRLAANTPPTCSGKVSPGINNHWAKWSPEVQPSQAGKYYWLIFSSNRAGLADGTSSKGRAIKMSQLYLAPIFVDEVGTVNSYPAIYLWNQHQDRVNITPAWETFDIPIIP
jgi:hypothetical protein